MAGANGYDLDESTDNFNAYFNSTCAFSLEGSYQLSYKFRSGGRIEPNKLSDLSGISVKVLFFWLNIVEITRSGDDLEFSVGLASASFPNDNFFECPQCGCGLDCGGESRRMKMEIDRDGSNEQRSNYSCSRSNSCTSYCSSSNSYSSSDNLDCYGVLDVRVSSESVILQLYSYKQHLEAILLGELCVH